MIHFVWNYGLRLFTEQTAAACTGQRVVVPSGKPVCLLRPPGLNNRNFSASDRCANRSLKNTKSMKAQQLSDTNHKWYRRERERWKRRGTFVFCREDVSWHSTPQDQYVWKSERPPVETTKSAAEQTCQWASAKVNSRLFVSDDLWSEGLLV